MNRIKRNRLRLLGLLVLVFMACNFIYMVLITWPQDSVNEALLIACENRDVPEAAQAIREGANVNSDTSFEPNCYALLIAAKDDDAPIVKLLLDHGANPNVVGDEGVTPMSLAWKPEVKALIAKAILERASRR
jgi:ankyrin repeat protein